MAATTDGDNEYQNEFNRDELIDVNASIIIDSESVGKDGYLYAVVFKKGALFNRDVFYMLTVDQGLIPWDLTLETLEPITALKELNPEENFKIFDDFTGEPGNYSVYIGYQRVGGELYYTIDPLEFTVR